MDGKTSTNVTRIYPSAPLEEPVMASHRNEEQQDFLFNTPPAPPPTYAQATGVPDETTTQQKVVVITPRAQIFYGPRPVDLLCPFCRNYTRTRLRSQPSTRTHLVALFLCLFQMYCCVCLPYCIADCMNTEHYCGLCDRHLGTYMRE